MKSSKKLKSKNYLLSLFCPVGFQNLNESAWTAFKTRTNLAMGACRVPNSFACNSSFEGKVARYLMPSSLSFLAVHDTCLDDQLLNVFGKLCQSLRRSTGIFVSKNHSIRALKASLMADSIAGCSMRSALRQSVANHSHFTVDRSQLLAKTSDLFDIHALEVDQKGRLGTPETL